MVELNSNRNSLPTSTALCAYESKAFLSWMSSAVESIVRTRCAFICSAG